MNDALAEAFFPRDNDASARLRQAIVSSVTPTEVTLGDQSGIPAESCSSYIPVVDDVVLVVQFEDDIIIIDSVDLGG